VRHATLLILNDCYITVIRAGSVSVFGVSIGIRYFRRYFFLVGSVFGIGISDVNLLIFGH